MKLIMSIPTLLTILVVAIIIALPPLSPLPVSAYSDESETNAEQRLRQKNVGSGESTNFNCDENMITSASDGSDCIPSGPAPPTPPTGAFTINGEASGTIECQGEDPASSDISIFVTGEESRTVTGSVIFVLEGGTLPIDVTGGTTDGDTFSVSGALGICSGAFTVSGDCGTGVAVSYEDSAGSGTFTGDVECTLL
jgi:hypothetical protein